MSDLRSGPVVFEAHLLPRKEFKVSATFSFDIGRISISKAALERLDALDIRRVIFVEYKKELYVTRVEKNGFWINLTHKRGDVVGGHIAHKYYTQKTMRRMGMGPGESSCVLIAPHKVSAQEIELDPLQYPFPFYRLALKSNLTD